MINYRSTTLKPLSIIWRMKYIKMITVKTIGLKLKKPWVMLSVQKRSKWLRSGSPRYVRTMMMSRRNRLPKVKGWREIKMSKLRNLRKHSLVTRKVLNLTRMRLQASLIGLLFILNWKTTEKSLMMLLLQSSWNLDIWKHITGEVKLIMHLRSMRRPPRTMNESYKTNPTTLRWRKILQKHNVRYMRRYKG